MQQAMGKHRRVSGRMYSVGYEGLEIGALVDSLRSARVTLVVDVRLNAVSRRRGFSKKALSAELHAAGIEYRHEPGLGNPPENRDSFRSGSSEEGRRRMREILENGSGPTLRHLVSDARESRIAVLCVERDRLRCHRDVITEMVSEIDPAIEVVQIL